MNFTRAFDNDGVDARGVDREDTFDSDCTGHLADRDGLADARVLLLNNDALERLDTFLGTFDNLDVNGNGIASTEFRKVGLQIFVLDCFNVQGHNVYLVIICRQM